MTILSSIANITVGFAKQILPEIVQEVVHQAWADPRLGKIVGGTFCALSGAGLFVYSGVPRKVRSWIQPHREFAVKPRYMMAIGGLTLIAAGICSIWQGCQELFLPRKDFSLTVFSKSECSALVSQKETLLACPDGVKLVERLEEEGPFTVHCLNTQELTRICGNSPACTKIEERDIYNGAKLDSPNLARLLIFEMNNLKHSKEISTLKQEGCALTDKVFANRLEMIEFASTKETTTLFNQCFSKHFGVTAKEISLETHLQSAEQSGHTEYYRAFHRSICNKT